LPSNGEDAVNSQSNGVMFCEVRGMTKFIDIWRNVSTENQTLLYFLFNTYYSATATGAGAASVKGKTEKQTTKKY